MNVGLPGTGIGGLFYLLAAFLMPVVEIFQTIRGRSNWERWRIVGRQVVLAGGVIVGLMATGWALKCVLPHAAINSLRSVSAHTKDVCGATPTKLTLITLIGVVAAVEAIRLLSLFSHQVHRALKSSP